MKSTRVVRAAAQMKFRAAIADDVSWMTEVIHSSAKAGADVILCPERAVTGRATKHRLMRSQWKVILLVCRTTGSLNLSADDEWKRVFNSNILNLMKKLTTWLALALCVAGLRAAPSAPPPPASQNLILSALRTRTGDAEAALRHLDIFIKAFILRNGFHVNGEVRTVNATKQ
jgi:hypothetical protein